MTKLVERLRDPKCANSSICSTQPLRDEAATALEKAVEALTGARRRMGIMNQRMHGHVSNDVTINAWLAEIDEALSLI
jgi:hypothetical protein